MTFDDDDDDGEHEGLISGRNSAGIGEGSVYEDELMTDVDEEAAEVERAKAEHSKRRSVTKPVNPSPQTGAPRVVFVNHPRDIIFCVFDGTPDSCLLPRFWQKVGAIVMRFTFLVVGLSVINLCVESLPEISRNGLREQRAITVIEAACIAWFCFEYAIRFVTSRRRLVWMMQPMALLDIATIAPFFVDMVVVQSVRGLAALRVVRLVRVIRLFKLSNSGILDVIKAMKHSTNALTLLFFLLFIAVLVWSTLIFFVEQSDSDFDEHSRQWIRPDGTLSPFQSVYHSMWFCIVTMTTVGYGNDVPATPAGKALSALMMISGVLVIAFPTVVLSASFHEAYSHRFTLLLLKRIRQRQIEAIDFGRRVFGEQHGGGGCATSGDLAAQESFAPLPADDRAMRNLEDVKLHYLPFVRPPAQTRAASLPEAKLSPVGSRLRSLRRSQSITGPPDDAPEASEWLGPRRLSLNVAEASADGEALADLVGCSTVAGARSIGAAVQAEADRQAVIDAALKRLNQNVLRLHSLTLRPDGIVEYPPKLRLECVRGTSEIRARVAQVFPPGSHSVSLTVVLDDAAYREEQRLLAVSQFGAAAVRGAELARITKLSVALKVGSDSGAPRAALLRHVCPEDRDLLDTCYLTSSSFRDVVASSVTVTIMCPTSDAFHALQRHLHIFTVDFVVSFTNFKRSKLPTVEAPVRAAATARPTPLPPVAAVAAAVSAGTDRPRGSVASSNGATFPPLALQSTAPAFGDM